MKTQVTVCLCFGILLLYSLPLGHSEYLQNPSNIQENTNIEQFKKLNDDNILNECFDLVVQNISDFIKKENLDSSSVPDTKESFKWKIGFIPITGEIGLKNGIFSGLSTVSRRKSIITSYSNGTISIHAPLEFKTMKLSSDYTATLLGFGLTGKVTGEIKSLQVTLDLDVSLRPIAIKLSKFQVENSGNISVNFSGSDVADEVLTILTSVVANIFRGIIFHTIENAVHQPLQNQIDFINKLIVNIFSP